MCVCVSLSLCAYVLLVCVCDDGTSVTVFERVCVSEDGRVAFRKLRKGGGANI